MATIEQENQMRQNLIAQLATLQNINIEDLARDDLGKELNFRAGLPSFERLLKIFRDLSESNLNAVPYNRLNNLNSIAQSAIQQFNAIRGFSLQQYPQNPTQTRDQFINAIREAYDNAFEHLSPILAHSSRKELNLEHLETKAKISVEKLNAIIAEQEKARSAMMSDIDGTIEKIKRAAQEAGVAQHAAHFKEEADEHKAAAKSWLLATALVSLATLIAAILGFYYLFVQIASLDITKSLQLTVAKLIIFSVLFSGVFWMGRVYRAHRHNYIINKHRQNALSTFEAFVKAANDDQTKSAVLLQATNCIFSQQHTGYISQESDATGSLQILEIIRGMSGSQGRPT